MIVLRHLLGYTPGEIAAISSFHAVRSTPGCAAGSTSSQGQLEDER